MKHGGKRRKMSSQIWATPGTRLCYSIMKFRIPSAIRDFQAALTGGQSIIAEVKRKSPSNPDLQRLGPPGTLARAYQRGGARALSIVTDAAHFGTSLDDVAALRAATDLPEYFVDSCYTEWAGDDI